MSKYCYKDKHAPPGARYPDGLPCTCKPCPPIKYMSTMSTSVYSDLGLSEGKQLKSTMPHRAVPTGENRKTPFQGGDGETSPKTFPPYKIKLAGTKRKSMSGEGIDI